jgi:ectoine hydroxylase-related dioxygenase (phytanoyl-CoA dioxygenase family)
MTDFARDGFAMWAEVLAPSEVDALAAALEGIAGRSRAGARRLMRDAAVAALVGDLRLLGLARGILGGAATAFRATLFDKSAASNWLVAWHQDTALPVVARADGAGWRSWSVKGGVIHGHAPASVLEGVVALRVQLDDSDAENGPLRVLPATHRSGLLSEAAIADLAATVAPHACTVAAGGVIAMRPLLVHASSKAATPARRRVLHIEYAVSLDVGPGLRLAIA